MSTTAAAPPPAAAGDADREARIAARRRRIAEKLAAIRHGDTKGPQEVSKASEMSVTSQQLLESSRRLVQLKYDSSQAVSAVRVAGDGLENARRAKEEAVRQELRAKLLAEVEASTAANARIAVRWGGVLELDVPQELFAAIEQQREACEAVIASKDRLLADIRAALKAKDEAYVRLLKRQAADVDALLEAMARQLAELTEAFREELDAIERALLQERAELLASNRREVESLLEARSAAEVKFTDNYLAAVDAYARNLEGLRHADAEDYQVLKIKLEGDIAVLEQHLETMRATYQLNAEKLEYNHRVLLERDAENTATINQQKRKLSRQHDVLCALKGKYASGEAMAAQENARLTDEYRRITEQFEDLQAKFRHFGRVDAARHSQLWRLQQEEAGSLVAQLLAADRVIHEQQLGWAWAPPDGALLVSPHDHASGQRQLRSAAAASGAARGAAADARELEQRSEQPLHSTATFAPASGSSSAAAAAAADDDHDDEAAAELGSAQQAAAEPSASGSSSAGGSASGSGAAAEADAPAPQLSGSAEVVSRLAQPHNWGALGLLLDEAGFLLEARAAELLASLPANQARLVGAEAVVRALGVADGPAFDALLDALTDGGGGGAAERAAVVAAGGSAPPPVLVDPSDALLRLKAFVESEAGLPSAQPHGLGSSASSRASRAASPAGGSLRPGGAAPWPPGAAAAPGGLGSLARTAAPGGVGGAGGAGLGGAFQGQVVSRRMAGKEREYWEGLTHAVSDKVVRVWGRLEQQLGSYHGLLVARAEGLAAIQGLQRQNEELRALLNQYLGSKINAELKIPPTAVL